MTMTMQCQPLHLTTQVRTVKKSSRRGGQREGKIALGMVSSEPLEAVELINPMQMTAICDLRQMVFRSPTCLQSILVPHMPWVSKKNVQAPAVQ
jgi:hypothetical protein